MSCYRHAAHQWTLAQVAVLPANEWRRINEKLRSWENPSPTKAAQMQTKREELHKQSQSIVKNWENTIEGQRLKRLQARQIREEKEEVSFIVLHLSFKYYIICREDVKKLIERRPGSKQEKEKKQ